MGPGTGPATTFVFYGPCTQKSMDRVAGHRGEACGGRGSAALSGARRAPGPSRAKAATVDEHDSRVVPARRARSSCDKREVEPDPTRRRRPEVIRQFEQDRCHPGLDARPAVLLEALLDPAQPRPEGLRHLEVDRRVFAGETLERVAGHEQRRGRPRGLRLRTPQSGLPRLPPAPGCRRAQRARGLRRGRTRRCGTRGNSRRVRR